MSTIAMALKWIKKEGRWMGWQNKAKRIAFASTVYHIWATRNKQIFEDVVSDKEDIIHKIKSHVHRVMFVLYPDVLSLFETLAIT